MVIGTILFITMSILFIIFCWAIGLTASSISDKDNWFKAICIGLLAYFVVTIAYTFGYLTLVAYIF